MDLKKAIFFDRDGVLNQTEVRDGHAYAPLVLEDFALLPGVADAVRKSQEAGFLAIVITNQPELATGELSSETLTAMHQILRDDLLVDAVYVCPHQDADRCSCRKPLPGMIHDATKDWNLDLAASFLVGDRWRDIDAGRAAGCRTILIERKYSGVTEPDFRAADVGSAVKIILSAANLSHPTPGTRQ
jgi:D-glycero-D-manno-heptose 1,7-bisphosphate phosphatase